MPQKRKSSYLFVNIAIFLVDMMLNRDSNEEWTLALLDVLVVIDSKERMRRTTERMARQQRSANLLSPLERQLLNSLVLQVAVKALHPAVRNR